MASTHIESPTLANPATGASKKGTWSFWMKRGNLGGSRILNTNENSNNEFLVSFKTDDTMQIYQIAGGSNLYQYRTNRKFRDINSWYHIVLAIDTTLGTAGDRVKLYVNGVQETSFQTTTNNMPQNHSFHGLYGGIKQNIGRDVAHGSEFFDGVLSYFAFIDGTQELPTIFGETDSTTGEWKIKTTITPSSAWGTNGYLILKDGNSLTDQSTNSNNFSSVAGTLTKTEDNPSNVFCTLNPINSRYISIIQGNNTASGGNNGSDYSYIGSTLAANSGKFYWEVKAADLAEIDQVGVARASSSFAQVSTGHGLQGTPYGGKSVQFSNGNKAGDDSQSAYMGGFSTDDIMMIALDLDNNKITFGRNGQWANGSGGADQTYANSTAAYTNLTAGEYYVPAQAKRASGANYGTNNYNFGNGYFGTTAVSSAGTNASGIGIFEYDVPTGFTALSTKGLNE